MSWKLVDEVLVPSEHGRGWQLNAGQRMRIIAVEGPQVEEPGVFNLWMNVEYTADMGIEIEEAQCQKGDYIDFLVHMDCLITFSACPGTEKGVCVINDDVNKPPKAEIWGQSACQFAGRHVRALRSLVSRVL